MIEFLLNQSDFDKCFSACKEYYQEHYGDIDNALEYEANYKLAEEIKLVEKTEDLRAKWGRLIASNIFRLAVGEWDKLENNCLYVEETEDEPEPEEEGDKVANLIEEFNKKSPTGDTYELCRYIYEKAKAE